MNKLVIKFFVVIWLVFCQSCNTNQSKNDSEGTSKDSINNTDEDLRQEGELQNIITTLQGTWKRDSYPYGTIVFDAQQIKFNTGEGLAEAPEFMDFKLAKVCPVGQVKKPSKNQYDVVIITGDSNCNFVKLDDDYFNIYYTGSTSPVKYLREQTD